MDDELKEVLEEIKPTIDELFNVAISKADDKEKSIINGIVGSLELAGLQYSMPMKVQVLKQLIDGIDEALTIALEDV